MPIGNHYPGRPPQGAGEVRGGIVDRHDRIAGGDQRGEAVDVVGVVDVAEPLDLDPQLAFRRLALGLRIAVLQVDEATARRLRERREVGERGAG